MLIGSDLFVATCMTYAHGTPGTVASAQVTGKVIIEISHPGWSAKGDWHRWTRHTAVWLLVTFTICTGQRAVPLGFNAGVPEWRHPQLSDLENWLGTDRV